MKRSITRENVALGLVILNVTFLMLVIVLA